MVCENEDGGREIAQVRLHGSGDKIAGERATNSSDHDLPLPVGRSVGGGGGVACFTVTAK